MPATWLLKNAVANELKYEDNSLLLHWRLLALFAAKQGG